MKMYKAHVVQALEVLGYAWSVNDDNYHRVTLKDDAGNVRQVHRVSSTALSFRDGERWAVPWLAYELELRMAEEGDAEKWQCYLDALVAIPEAAVGPTIRAAPRMLAALVAEGVISLGRAIVDSEEGPF